MFTMEDFYAIVFILGAILGFFLIVGLFSPDNSQARDEREVARKVKDFTEEEVTLLEAMVNDKEKEGDVNTFAKSPLVIEQATK